MAESGFLIDGFENRPGTHPWQGEHLHAATLTWLMTGEDGSGRIANDGIALIPYYLTCTDDSGPRTYFKCA